MSSARTFTFLGTGTSVGVPMVACRCDVCTSSDPRNHRYRCAVLIRTPLGTILIDTPPELRLQLLRERVERIDAVLYTHYHADHLFGLDDLRPYSAFSGQAIPLFCTDEVEQRIREAFAYAFPQPALQPRWTYIPQLSFQRIDSAAFAVLSQSVTPIALEHGGCNVLGFRFGNVAYCTDVSAIPEASWRLLEGLDVLVLDALRFKPHPTHLSINEALEVIARLRPARAYLTHMSHDIDHETVNRQLPQNVELAYDGLSFSF